MMENKSNPLIEKTLKFALDIIEFCELLEEKRKFVIAKQLLRSGTSIGANSHEAQNPSSKNDFIHKMKIVAKEEKKQSIGCTCANILNHILLTKV